MNINCISKNGGRWVEVTVNSSSTTVNESLGTTSEKEAFLRDLLDSAYEVFDALGWDDKARYAYVKEYGFTKHLDNLVEGVLKEAYDVGVRGSSLDDLVELLGELEEAVEV